MSAIIVNGNILLRHEADFSEFVRNQPLVFSHKMWFGFGGIPLFEKNLAAIRQQFELLGYELPALYQNTRELFRLSKRMLNRNRYFRSGILNHLFFIAGGTLNYYIESKASDEFNFPFPDEGLLINFSPFRIFSQAFENTPVIARQGLWHLEKNSNNVIFLNENNFIADGCASNLFMIKGNLLLTPQLSAGVVENTLRSLVIEEARQVGLKIYELDNIQPEHLEEMDEAFFASEERGIEWILGIKTKRFVRASTARIYHHLNKRLEQLAASN